jgi:hypothetical protein
MTGAEGLLPFGDDRFQQVASSHGPPSRFQGERKPYLCSQGTQVVRSEELLAVPQHGREQLQRRLVVSGLSVDGG